MPLEIRFGIDASRLKAGEKVEIVWRENEIVNPHVLIVGMSGAGKTHNLRRMIKHLEDSADKPIRIHVFDVHGDIELPRASTVMFSKQTSHGLNPLVINPDPHYGGVRKRIQSFISILNRSRALGTKQENVIRNLLGDLYEIHGFRLNNPETWHVNTEDSKIESIDGKLYLDVPFSEKDDAHALGARWDGEDRNGW
jgi:DNA helicase HerA-like ATPase